MNVNRPSTAIAGRAAGSATCQNVPHMLAPSMAVLGLFTFMAAWTDFLWPLLVLGPKNPSVQTALSALNASGGHSPDYSMVLAGTIISIIPLLILFLFAGKQLIAGIMSGAVKG